MSRHDEAKPRVTGGVVTPDKIEMGCAPPAACFPAGRELRAARDTHAARVPLARLPAPVFGWRTDGETLATLLATTGQCGTAPDGFHPRPESMLIDAPPISRPICRTHKFPRVRPGNLPGPRVAGQGSRLVDFSTHGPYFRAPLLDVPPFLKKMVGVQQGRPESTGAMWKSQPLPPLARPV